MPRTPLYRSPTARARGTEGHRGLWFDKFCSLWSDEGWDLGTKKSEWVAQVTGNTGVSSLLKEYRDRQTDFIASQGGDYRIYQSIIPVVSGLGRSNPVENGFVWHQTLGTPYFPGSSIKGAVRAWAKQTLSEEQVNLLFGADADSGNTSLGTVIFLDALPYQQCVVQHDVMTPHYSDWYSAESTQLRDNLPGDWHSPTPIPFLSIAPKQKFMFGFICKNKSDTEVILRLLEETLFELGLGAKTSSGYGRFRPDDEVNQNLVQAREEKKRKQLAEEKLRGMKEWDRDFEQCGSTHDSLARWIIGSFESKSEEYKLGFVCCMLSKFSRKELKSGYKEAGLAGKTISNKELNLAWKLLVPYFPEV